MFFELSQGISLVLTTVIGRCAHLNIVGKFIKGDGHCFINFFVSRKTAWESLRTIDLVVSLTQSRQKSIFFVSAL